MLTDFITHERTRDVSQGELDTASQLQVHYQCFHISTKCTTHRNLHEKQNTSASTQNTPKQTTTRIQKKQHTSINNQYTYTDPNKPTEEATDTANKQITKSNRCSLVKAADR